MKKPLFFLLSWVLTTLLWAQRPMVPIFFWNVENFFDCTNDSLTLDDEFTPEGERHWTPKRYAIKRDMLVKTIIGMGDVCGSEFPVVVGLCEVENDQVLRDLTLGTPLRNLDYGFVHYDSRERRGVDCALLYRKDRIKILASYPIFVGDTAEDFLTRDILQAVALLDSRDTLVLFVCHMPSKLGGEQAEVRRNRICMTLRDSIIATQRRHPQTYVIAMGDMNSEAHELRFLPEGSQEPLGFINLSTFHHLDKGAVSTRSNRPPSSRSDVGGSYFYQGNWSTIDQILVSPNLVAERRLRFGHRLSIEVPFFVFAPDWLLEEASNHLSSKPYRTYQGPRYHGGVSDHLPVGIILKK